MRRQLVNCLFADLLQVFYDFYVCTWQVHNARLYKELNKQTPNTINFKKTWFAEIYKKLPCIFQATNEVVFLLVAYKTAKKNFLEKFMLKFELMYLPEMLVNMV